MDCRAFACTSGSVADKSEPVESLKIISRGAAGGQLKRLSSSRLFSEYLSRVQHLSILTTDPASVEG